MDRIRSEVEAKAAAETESETAADSQLDQADKAPSDDEQESSMEGDLTDEDFQDQSTPSQSVRSRRRSVIQSSSDSTVSVPNPKLPISKPTPRRKRVIVEEENGSLTDLLESRPLSGKPVVISAATGNLMSSLEKLCANYKRTRQRAELAKEQNKLNSYLKLLEHANLLHDAIISEELNIQQLQQEASADSQVKRSGGSTRKS